MDFDFHELSRLELDIRSATGAVGARAAAAFKKTAYDIERDAKAAAPVDTGTLRSSISVASAGDGRFESLEYEIGPTVDYAGYVEEGTSTHAPQPYLRPAAEKNIPGLVAAVEQIGATFL